MELLHRMTTAMISRAFLMSALLLAAVAVSAQRNGVAEKQCYEKPSHAEVSAFEAAASQFLRYRQSQCEFQTSLAAGGNGAVDRRLLCEIDLNNRRIAELQTVQGFLQ